jgi:hypothetical protein
MDRLVTFLILVGAAHLGLPIFLMIFGILFGVVTGLAYTHV